MKKYLVLVLASLALTVALSNSKADAALSFTGSVVNGINTWQDQSLEVVIDADNNGFISNGDILYGFARLDSQTTPANALITDSTYIVFSQQVVNYDVGDIYIEFAPTTNVSYTLSALTGDAIDSNAFLAIYQNVAGFGDLVVNNAGNAANIATISAGQFILSAGIGETDDFFTAQAVNPGAVNLNFVVDDGADVAFFGAGLTILEQPGLPAVVFAGDVSAIELGTLTQTFHELRISGGTVSGRGVAALNPNPYSFINQLQATVNVEQIVPEPASMLVWSGLSIVGFGLAAARKRRLAAKTA
jgi:hypothetical protein